VILVILMATPFLAVFYNYNLHPLSFLSSDIKNGDGLESVQNKFKSYAEIYGGDDEFQYALRFPDKSCDRHKKVAEGCIFIRDNSIFDVVQLTVFFDADGRVVDKLYIGD